MSIAVDVAQLRDAIADTDRAPYLVTVADDGRPHSVAVSFTWRGDELVVPVGNRTLANARERSLVSLVWPPKDPAGHSLIVDATVVDATGDGSGDNAVSLRPTRAVLHRPAQGTDTSAQSGCAADCVPLAQP